MGSSTYWNGFVILNQKGPQRFYKDYICYHDQYLSFQINYFVYKMDGRILAGLQANPDSWKIIHFPGASGKIIRKIFNLDALRFVTIEAIWFESGYQNRLQSLIKSACGYHNIHLTFIWQDMDSPIFHSQKKHVRMGLANSIGSRVPGDIRIKFSNMSDTEKDAFRNRPSYISCFDMT